MAAADFAKSRAGQAAAAANVSLSSVAAHASDAVRGGVTLMSGGAGRVARAVAAQRRPVGAADGGDGDGSGVDDGGGGSAGNDSGSDISTTDDVGDANKGGGGSGGGSGKLATAAAALTRKFSGLGGAFKRSNATAGAASTGNMPASAGQVTRSVGKVRYGLYRRMFVKNKDDNAPAGAATGKDTEDNDEAATAEEEEAPYFFVPGKVYHLRRGPLGKGSHPISNPWSGIEV